MGLTVKEMKIDVKSISGQNAVSSHHGDILYQQILSAINRDEVAELDFDGVEIFSTPFFNLAVARLLQDRSSSYLNDRVKFLNLSPVGFSTLRRVIANAKDHYSQPTTH
jgi:hypothetical protein